MDRYHNLTEMLAINRTAHAYFDSLPDYIREMITARGANVHSPDELGGGKRACARKSATVVNARNSTMQRANAPLINT